MITRIIFGCLVFLIIINNASAYNPYGDVYTYDVYYNDELLGLEAAKPNLKIGEPFTIRIDIKVYQNSFVYVELTELGKDNFEIISGPTSQLGMYSEGDFCEINSTQTYEWTVVPTENWAGGSVPLDIYYAIYEPNNSEPLVSSGFTAVLPYISTEYYDGPEPTPAESPENDTNQTPAFTLLAALLAIALVALRKKC
ncbi:sarcinarray family MAST domain-containing protein [Methanococcoides sp. FTZ1]|uniref:sarcinarray family MAST domain-containing protein n=1 Tax=Methanococcoides sp. FTZ1 TaxID=3439061 RepID=UPI003F8241B3